MQLFLDTTDVAVLKDLAMTGLVDGVTTNPTLIAKSGRNMLQVIGEICAAVDGPVSAEVAAMDTAGMLDEGRKLAGIAPNVVVKVPLTRDGLIATREFAHEGIATNVTLCFSAAQALLAAKAGATYISPFIGRPDLAISVGLVVTPSTRPVAARSFRTATSVVSRKSCMAIWALILRRVLVAA